MPLVLVIAMLLGSVLLPARQSWRIMQLLRETTEIIEPARILGARLEFGLMVESSALDAFRRSGNSFHRVRYDVAAADNDRRLASIGQLVSALDADALERVAVVRRRIHEWRAENSALLASVPGLPPAGALPGTPGSYEVALQEVTRLASYLAAEGSARRELIRGSEWLGLLVNASLVFIAIGAVLAVGALSRRERRLTAILRQRVHEESVLRDVARAIAASSTPEELLRQLAQGATVLTNSSGAYVEACGGDRGSVDCVLHAAASRTSQHWHGPIAGSVTEVITERGDAGTITELGSLADRIPVGAGPGECWQSGLVVPMRVSGEVLGALVILRGSPRSPFGDAEHRQLEALVGLATTSLLRVAMHAGERLALEVARQGRRELERVMTSRSRLMRGFSHDVKNPLSAADGYAELLTEGIYGALSHEQLEILGRIRRSIHGAIALIEDLHEMARAETGHIHLVLEAVDLAELARSIGQDYRAVAESSGLSLSVELHGAPIIVDTDATRVRQILSNLLSNAIKYTASGQVVLRVRRDTASVPGDPDRPVAIEVSDTGGGIPPEKHAAIFEEFVRLGANEKSGAGLGLAVSQRLAQALGGHIALESELARGSTFTLWLPGRATQQSLVHSAAVPAR